MRLGGVGVAGAAVQVAEDGVPQVRPGQPGRRGQVAQQREPCLRPARLGDRDGPDTFAEQNDPELGRGATGC
jgi:hypothetical protein